MTPFEFTILAFVIAVGAGVFGALLGLGGGIIVVPGLTLLLGVPIRFAIGASIVAVIATSSGSAAGYVRQRLSNIRIGMFLEAATTTGALTGAFIAGIIAGRWLYIIFAVVMFLVAIAMYRRRQAIPIGQQPPDRLADRLRLHSTYYDLARRQTVAYRVSRTPLGLGVSYLAGIMSGLLGVGGGVMKVPAMNLAMHLPLKIATATSNFMIGVTAAASAGVYFSRGQVDPFVAAPVAVGVLLGARAGSHLLPRLHSRYVRVIFVLVLIYIAVEMFLKGWRGGT